MQASLCVSLDEVRVARNQCVELEINHMVDFPADFGTLVKPLTGDLSLSLVGRFLQVSGSLAADLTLYCDRCLKEFNHSFEFAIAESLELNLPEELPQELELTLEEAWEQLDPNGDVDVLDLIRQHLLLALPSKRLCSPDCANSQLEDLHRAIAEAGDPRWEKLKNIPFNHQN